MLLLAQGVDGQLCAFQPIIIAGSSISGVEDTPLSVYQQWTAIGGSAQGKLYSKSCANDGNYINWNNVTIMRAVFSVKYGKLWLAPGYPSCGVIIDQNTKFDTQMEALTRVFSFISNVDGVNCIIRHLYYQGLPNANQATQRNLYGEQPQLVIQVVPTCQHDFVPICIGAQPGSPSDCATQDKALKCAAGSGQCVSCTCSSVDTQPPFCGAEFTATFTSTTAINLSPVEDLPFLQSCPYMSLVNRSSLQYLTSPSDFWSKSEGGPRCSAVPIQSAPAVYTGSNAATQIFPVYMHPSYCGDGCAGYPINAQFCLPNAGSYAYHIEDLEAVDLMFNGIYINDLDFTTGQLQMSNFFVIPAGLIVGNFQGAGSITPPPAISSSSGTMGSYCAIAKPFSTCATAVSSSTFGNLPVLQADKMRLRIVATTVRPLNSAGGCDLSAQPQLACSLVNQQCSCRSQTYSVQGSNRSVILFYELFSTVDNNTLETGYIDFNMFQAAGSSFDTVNGQMFADPGRVYSAALQQSVDWFAASPMTVSGVYNRSTETLQLSNIKTSPQVNPTLTLTVAAKYGTLTLQGSGSKLVTDSRTMKTIEGTVDEVNLAISKLKYSVPGPSIFPYLNTMTSVNGVRHEEILSIDVFNTLNASSRVQLNFSIVIVAVNNAPNIAVQSSYEMARQDQDFLVPNLVLTDPDAEEILLGQTAPKGGAQISLQLSCKYGTLRVAQLTASNDMHFYLSSGDAACAKVCASMPKSLPDLTTLQLLPSTCQDCMQAEGLRRAREGGKEISLFANLETGKRFLGNLTYRGDPGYNNKTVDSVPSGLVCETAMRPHTESKDQIVMSVYDLGNTGCTNQLVKSGTSRIVVEVVGGDDTPTVALYEDGKDVCTGCGSNQTCCSSKQVVVASEDTILSFSEKFQLVLQSSDSMNFDFPTYRFQLQLTARYGKFSFKGSTSSFITANNPLESYSLSADKRVLTATNSMCRLNQLLQQTQYLPDPNFNSLLKVFDQLQVKIAQVFPATSQVGSTSTFPVDVRAVNDPPNLYLNSDLTGSSSLLQPVHQVETETYDFFEGGEQGSKCPAGQKCFSISDIDICEQKYLSFKVFPSSMDEIAMLTGAVCARTVPDGEGKGDMLVTFQSNIGSIWFFSRYEWQLRQGGGDVSDAAWLAFVKKVRPDDSAGKENRVVNMTRPLPYFKGGLLRYYASRDYAQTDNISIALNDLGNTGGPDPSRSKFCCCSDRSCSTCSSQDCNLQLAVSSCSKVPGWTCRDKVVFTDTGLSDLSVTAITVAVGFAFLLLASSLSFIAVGDSGFKAGVGAGAKLEQYQVAM
ncbi:hypothetical protein GUITHDRAFT_118037 [Guillardia theta CCMP2712]|uniref:Uncharacterized protein n=1 Tax=Guillardia theta (strain CCMP2712) TaxID=905079 RepID=L1IHN8_GUITC|nr:hypothetical protein GUITHDRAFT_118037 [Guillardia theta CCMP2712]EKX35761.1 hypothetical protein GUITHDRAFT_118037 [Guillardia theta CCMP2712]|eukprot:XP_005822741.1 hypothetical protein GUITHDRAFT_118037 [Guillardia theta CCMP2712]